MAEHLPTDVHAEFELTAGDFTDTYGGVDLAARVRGQDAVRINRGQISQQSLAGATQANFTLNNADALFTEDNPGSPLYGIIGENTRVRLGVQSDGTWAEYLRTPDINGAHSQVVSTADKASLDITGDLDMRIEITPFYARGQRMSLAGKWNVGLASRSYFLEWRTNGTLALATSPDGTIGAALTNVTSVSMPADAGHVAIRVTLDVNNGAGGRVYTWYTADTIAGPWTQIATSTVAGTTSIYNGSAALEVGSVNGAAGPFTGSRAFPGKVHAFELYSGIGGTLVADFKPAGRGVGANSGWTDTCASPNTWTIVGANMRLASDRIRICGELTSLPDTWDRTGNDVWVPATAVGAIARYTSNKAPLRGAIYRNYSKYDGLTGYWPLEDESGSTQAANALSTGQPGSVVSCSFGAADGLGGATGALTLTSAPNVSAATFRPSLSQSTGATSFLFYFKMAALPAGSNVMVTIPSYGTASKWTVSISATTFTFTGTDLTGATVATANPAFGITITDNWIGMQLWLIQEGANVRWQTAWHIVGSDDFFTHAVGGSTYAGAFNYGFRAAQFGTPDAAFAGMQIAHVIMSSTALDLVSYRFEAASSGYDGETFGDRLLRLAEEEGVLVDWLGDLDDTPALGPQPADSLLNIFRQGAAVDGGIFLDQRDQYGFFYVARNYLGNRRELLFDYSESHLAEPPQRILDSQSRVNDFTATRPAGSSARYIADDGRKKNVNDPPVGVGRFELTGSFNAATDEQLPGLAQFQVAIGTVEGRRIPNLSVGLHRTAVDDMLALNVIEADAGSAVTLTGLDDANVPMPPDDQFMVAMGYTEVFDGFLWSWVANTVPSAPYQVPVLDDPTGEDPRLDTDPLQPTELTASLTTTGTTVSIRTPRVSPPWCDTTGYAAEFPFDANLAGERVTVTAATSPVDSPDGTFESGVSDFLTSSGTFVQSSTFARTGTFSGLFTVTGTPVEAWVKNSVALAAAVQEGQWVAGRCWVRTTATLSISAMIDFYDDALSFLSRLELGGSVSSGAWTLRTVAGEVPADATLALFGPTITGSPATGSVMYVDDWLFLDQGWRKQDLTVTRSINGVVKAHDAGTVISLFDPDDLGMSV